MQIARNSYPLVLQLAMTNLERGPIGILMPSLLGRPFPPNPKYYAIDGSGNKARLVIAKMGTEQLRKVGGEELKDFRSGKSPTVGCPAMINFGDGSAINKLWNWHVEIAEKIYPVLARDD